MKSSPGVVCKQSCSSDVPQLLTGNRQVLQLRNARRWAWSTCAANVAQCNRTALQSSVLAAPRCPSLRLLAVGSRHLAAAARQEAGDEADQALGVACSHDEWRVWSGLEHASATPPARSLGCSLFLRQSMQRLMKSVSCRCRVKRTCPAGRVEHPDQAGHKGEGLVADGVLQGGMEGCDVLGSVAVLDSQQMDTKEKA